MVMVWKEDILETTKMSDVRLSDWEITLESGITYLEDKRNSTGNIHEIQKQNNFSREHVD
jgi:hypothetical protein